MLVSKRPGFTLLELFLAILVVAIAFTVALPAIPPGTLSEPIEDLGPVDVRVFRLEFASSTDHRVVESELRRILPNNESGRPSVCEVAARDQEPEVVYVALWLATSTPVGTLAPNFEDLPVPPIRITEVPNE